MPYTPPPAAIISLEQSPTNSTTNRQITTDVSASNQQGVPQVIAQQQVVSQAADLALSPNPDPHTVNVSSGNPCPFLRMLVAQGKLPDGEVPIDVLNAAIGEVVAVQDAPQEPISPTAIKAIASTANGLRPSQIYHNLHHGTDLTRLRGKIFDKKGTGSHILDSNANYVPAEFERLTTFASMKTTATGEQELGLNAQEIDTMLKANYDRAKGQRRLIDKSLMRGEFPILLKVLGTQGKTERYLATKDIERLFRDRQLPDRLQARLSQTGES